MRFNNTMLIWIIRLLLGALFIIAAYSKMISPWEFSNNVVNYKITGVILSRWIAVILPVLELLTGIYLLSGIWLKETFVISIGLYIIFDIMVLQAYIRGLDVACGCFSMDSTVPINVWKLAENFILTALSVTGLLLVYSNKKVRST